MRKTAAYLKVIVNNKYESKVPQKEKETEGEWEDKKNWIFSWCLFVSLKPLHPYLPPSPPHTHTHYHHFAKVIPQGRDHCQDRAETAQLQPLALIGAACQPPHQHLSQYFISKLKLSHHPSCKQHYSWNKNFTTLGWRRIVQHLKTLPLWPWAFIAWKPEWNLWVKIYE